MKWVWIVENGRKEYSLLQAEVKYSETWSKDIHSGRQTDRTRRSVKDTRSEDLVKDTRSEGHQNMSF